MLICSLLLLQLISVEEHDEGHDDQNDAAANDDVKKMMP
jgi:hypothetical protein